MVGCVPLSETGGPRIRGAIVPGAAAWQRDTETMGNRKSDSPPCQEGKKKKKNMGTTVGRAMLQAPPHTQTLRACTV